MMQNGSPKRNDGKSGKAPQRRKRRRPSANKRETPSINQKVLAQTSSLDSSVLSHENHHAPMSEDEIAEMKEHLEFLFKNRKRFNLKINAKEDLLLNGSREPTERGVCLHLLRKVDRNCVEAALERISEPKLKAHLLQGVVRFSSDISILILFLESLREAASKSEASTALTLGLRRIDFDNATKTQMSRVLDLVLNLFPKNKLPQILFGLLQSQSFRNAFDHSSDRLPTALHEIFVPIRTVFSAIVENLVPDDEANLKRGLALVLSNDIKTIAQYPPHLRERFFSYALQLTDKPTQTDPILQAILDSFSKKSRHYSTLGMLWAGQLLKRHADGKATKLLNQIKSHHPNFTQPSRWLEAIRAKRFGRIALLPSENPLNMQFGLWLDQQSPVLIRTGEEHEQESFTQQALLHSELFLPSVAPLLQSGTTDDGEPYLVTELVGHPASEFYKKRVNPSIRLQHCRDGIQILWSLGQLGFSLPTMTIERCAVDSKQRLWLVDLSGISQLAQKEALSSQFKVAKTWAQEQISYLPRSKKSLFASNKINHTTDFKALLSFVLELKR